MNHKSKIMAQYQQVQRQMVIYRLMLENEEELDEEFRGEGVEDI